MLDSSNLTRREFVQSVAASATLATALPNAFAQQVDRSNQFSFLLLGDTHFDRIEHHDLKWMKEEFGKDIRQVERYCQHTNEQLPGLLEAAGKRIGQADPATSFVLHVGDLVEGICGNEKLARLHCREGWEFFKSANFGVPFLMTKGNHDVTGPGSEEAYRDILLPRIAQELGREKLESTSYSFKQGDNLFAVFDAYDRNAIDWLEKLVEENEFQHLFVLLHMPVVPYNSRSNWRVYYHPNHAERRQRLLNVLGKHKAIVLSGHLHKHSILVRKTETGKFLQVALSSILKQSPGPAALEFSNLDAYGPDLTDLEPKFSPDSLADRKLILKQEQPFIEHFEYADVSGFAMLSVNDDQVYAQFFHDTNSEKPWRELSLMELLG